MPFKSEKIKIEGTKYDRRRRISEEMKAEIKRLYDMGTYSQRKLAKIFGVSRRTVYWAIYPEKYQHNLDLRQKRGGSKHYYNRDRHREYMKGHRRYKQKLYVKGKIKFEKNKGTE